RRCSLRIQRRLYRSENELLNGDKEFRPIFRVNGRWQLNVPPGLRPLWRLDEITAASLIVVTEGEKCADRARELGFIATTSSGGSGAAKKTDWSPLAGKDVIFLPDQDEPGEKYINDAGAILDGLASRPRIRVARLPVTGEGHDIADWVDEIVPDTWTDED